MAAGQHEAEAGHSERTGITAATSWRDSISSSTAGVRRRCPRAALNGHCFQALRGSTRRRPGTASARASKQHLRIVSRVVLRK